MQTSAWTSSGMARAACTRSIGASVLTQTTGSAAPAQPLCPLSDLSDPIVFTEVAPRALGSQGNAGSHGPPDMPPLLPARLAGGSQVLNAAEMLNVLATQAL
jgi:hypothetical protein